MLANAGVPLHAGLPGQFLRTAHASCVAVAISKSVLPSYGCVQYHMLLKTAARVCCQDKAVFTAQWSVWLHLVPSDCSTQLVPHVQQ